MAGVLPEEENWERIDYFLERVVPVAESNRIRLACHPHDPYTPPGYRGVTRVLGTVEGLKKFVTMHESPYHGLNFCQGTIAEMLDDPASGDRRCHPLVWRAQEDLQRPLPQHPRAQALLQRSVSRRRRHGHVGVDPALRRTRLRIHADARSRAGDQRPKSEQRRLRLLLRLYRCPSAGRRTTSIRDRCSAKAARVAHSRNAIGPLPLALPFCEN